MLAAMTGIVVPVPSAVRQVDVEPGADVGTRRHHEDVVVGQVPRRSGLRKEAHEKKSLTPGK